MASVATIFSRALDYGTALALEGTVDVTAARRRLLAECYRESARKLRETGEGGGVPDGAILLEQLADELDANRSLPHR